MSNNDDRERTRTLRQADIIERRETKRPGKNTEAELATLKLSEAQLDALIGKDGASAEDLFHEEQEDASKLPTKEFVLEASIMSHLSNPLLELPPLEDVGKDETARINEGVLKRTIAASRQEEGIGGEGTTRELKTPNALPSRLLNVPPEPLATRENTHAPTDARTAPRHAPREETVRVEFSNAEAKPLPNAGLKKTRERLLFIGIAGLALTLGGLVTVLLFMLFRS